MATNLPSCFPIQFSEQFLKFLATFTLLKYVKSQRSYGFLITKELLFGFQILDSLLSLLNCIHKTGRSSHFTLIADALFTVIMTTTVFVLHFCSSFYLITVRGSANERYVVH